MLILCVPVFVRRFSHFARGGSLARQVFPFREFRSIRPEAPDPGLKVPGKGVGANLAGTPAIFHVKNMGLCFSSSGKFILSRENSWAGDSDSSCQLHREHC